MTHAESTDGMSVARAPVSGRPGNAGEDRPLPLAGACEQTRMLCKVFQTIAGDVAGPCLGQWQFRLPGGRRKVSATLSDRWFSIALPLRAMPGPVDYRGITAMLRRNARTPGCPRVIGERLEPSRHLVIDFPADLLPWEREAELEALLARMVTELVAAGRVAASAPATPEGAALPLDQLASVFDQAGWPAQPAGAQFLEVPLDVPGHYLAARTGEAAGSLRLSASLPLAVGSIDGGDPGGTAATVLLWAVACRIRLVKPVRTAGGLGIEAELPLGHDPAARAGHLCAALSYAAQQYFSEAQQLVADPALARIYLANMGFQSAS